MSNDISTFFHKDGKSKFGLKLTQNAYSDEAYIFITIYLLAQFR